MYRRDFVATLGSAVGLTQLACAARAASPAAGTRRLRRVGVQLYSLRDDAKRDLERTIADIAAAGYNDVELLGSMNNFGMSPAALRAVLDRNSLRAPSSHVSGNALDNMQRELDDAQTLGHEYITVASLPITRPPTLDDYRRWGDRLNEAGRIARERNVWIAFHNHANDFVEIDGQVTYDVLGGNRWLIFHATVATGRTRTFSFQRRPARASCGTSTFTWALQTSRSVTSGCSVTAAAAVPQRRQV